MLSKACRLGFLFAVPEFTYMSLEVRDLREVPITVVIFALVYPAAVPFNNVFARKNGYVQLVSCSSTFFPIIKINGYQMKNWMGKGGT